MAGNPYPHYHTVPGIHQSRQSEENTMTPLIAADNHLLLWTFVMLAAAAAIYIEQNFR